MVSFPHCKVNLGLWIVAVRSDGYHDVETCLYPVPWSDALEVVPASSLALHCTGIPLPEQPANLCLRAYQLLRQDFDIPPVAIHLHKSIPIGAGLGGGSSDAVCILKTLNQLFSLSLSQQDLLHYAAQLGSDCPFFLYDGPMRGSGRGDELVPINVSLRGKTIALVYPQIPISSVAAYAGVTRFDACNRDALEHIYTNHVLWKTQLKNTFEASLFVQYPILAQIKERLYAEGAFYASLSGSGSTLFGLFHQPIDMSSRFPGMLCSSVEL